MKDGLAKQVQGIPRIGETDEESHGMNFAWGFIKEAFEDWSEVGPEGAKGVETLIENASKPSSGVIATALGIIVLLVGSSGFFGQLQDGLCRVRSRSSFEYLWT
jgi:uncharacterized BrkB/YihY/UPF0761 family membrane protein